MEPTISAIERSIKRALSAAEIDAIERVKGHLPADRRQAKRLLRQARERARKAEVASMKRAGKIREPTDEELHLALNVLSISQSPAHFDRRVRELGQRVPSEKLWANRAANDVSDRIVDPEMQRYETEANQFAGDALIPPAALAEFLRKNDFTNNGIHDFAEAIGVGPGIVVGRLQFEGLLKPHQGNALKQKLDWQFSEDA